jgi:protein HOOK3
MKAEKEKLLKKANTADHYKQKLQASQHLEVEMRQLREENERLSRDAHEDAQHQLSLSNKLIGEYKQTLSKVEQDYQDLVDVKKRLEFENASVHEKAEDTNARLARDQEEIQELNEKIQELESGTANKIDNLDDELASTKQSDGDS